MVGAPGHGCWGRGAAGGELHPRGVRVQQQGQGKMGALMSNHRWKTVGHFAKRSDPSSQGRHYGRGGVSQRKQGPSGQEAGWPFWQGQQLEQSMKVGWR